MLITEGKIFNQSINIYLYSAFLSRLKVKIFLYVVLDVVTKQLYKEFGV